MQYRQAFFTLLIAVLLVPMAGLGQSPWSKTIILKDRQDGGKTPDAAKVVLSAYFMNTRLAVGEAITMNSSGEANPVNFPAQNEGYIKFKIDKITWLDESGFDKSPEYKMIVRSLWVDMNPKIWLDIRKSGKSPDVLRRSFINAPNVENVFGDSLPPPFIFKVNRNDNYSFTMGFKVLTPKTARERPFPHTFNFTVRGLLRNAPEPLKPEEPEVVVIEPIEPIEELEEGNTQPEIPVEEDNSEIDAAVAKARKDEDTDRLIQLIQLYPDVPSVIEARGDLAIYMRRELIDSLTYEIDIEFEKFSRALPKRDQVDIAFALGNRELLGADRPYFTWRGDQLVVRPRRDNRDYILIATVKATPENKDQLVLNPIRDNIRFAYADTLEGEFVSLKIRGGSYPYLLHLEQKNGDDYFGVEGAMAIYGDTVLSKDRISKAFNLSEEGDFRMFVEDAEKLKKTGLGLVHIVPPPPIPPYVWYASGVGLVLLFVGYRFWLAVQRRKDEELQELIEARGGLDPKVKRKPKPKLVEFWKETSISDLSLHKSFIEEISNYLKERAHFPPGSKPMIEGLILGTVLKFDYEKEQYEVRLDRFRSIDSRPLDYYDEVPDREKWTEIREVEQDHRDLVKIGWLQVVEDEPMRLKPEELQFQDEQFSELFQLLLKIDIKDGERMCGFFTRTISGKVNNAEDRAEGVDHWMDWDKLEDAGYYENEMKPVTQAAETNIAIKNVNQRAEWA